MARSDWKRPDSFPLPKEGERRVILTLSYDGSLFHGWQSQNGEVSVQGEIERVLSEMLSRRVVVQGSGRTDSGVHALMQVAHFDFPVGIDGEKFKVILNTSLKKGIRILSSEDAEGPFHARYSTMSREYWYLVKDYQSFLPFDSGYVCQVEKLPPIDLLDTYASVLKGTHDFTTFSSSRDKSLSKMRDVYVSGWDMISDKFSLPLLRYRVAGNAFLYHQVRSMVGSMLEFAKKGKSKDEFRELLASKDRMKVGKTAPPDGLYLAEVSYDSGKYEWFERGEER